VYGDLVQTLKRLDKLDMLFTLESGLVELFIKGAPISIIENIDTKVHLVNGACGTMHQLELPSNITDAERRKVIQICTL
jgi:hypothetical protein